jgi:diadenosine tetraphosphate (Ap4A) HIT family hydrolase
MKENKIRENFDENCDKLFNTLYRDDGVCIFLDREEHYSIYTQMIVNDVAFSFDIPQRDFLRLTRAMNYAIRAIKIEGLRDHK